MDIGDTISKVLVALPQSLILGVFGMGMLTLILLPLALRLAGLTGAQIVDTFRLTTQFFLNLVEELRQQNKTA